MSFLALVKKWVLPKRKFDIDTRAKIIGSELKRLGAALHNPNFSTTAVLLFLTAELDQDGERKALAEQIYRGPDNEVITNLHRFLIKGDLLNRRNVTYFQIPGIDLKLLD